MEILPVVHEDVWLPQVFWMDAQIVHTPEFVRIPLKVVVVPILTII